MSTWDVRNENVTLVGANGIKLTKGLFREFGADCGPYTMYNKNKTIDGTTLISAYQVYMDSVNEYEAAMRLVGDMEHWRKLCETEWFLNGIFQGQIQITNGLRHWREDHSMKREAEALRALEAARDDGNVQAAKYLHEMVAKVSKERKKPEVKEVSKEDSLIKAALKRVK